MSPHASQADAAPAGLSSGLIALFAAACGLAVANIYFSQPLIGIIAPELRLHPGLAGLIVALTQLGYGAGLLLLVPLADVAENRRLGRSCCWAGWCWAWSASVCRSRRPAS